MVHLARGPWVIFALCLSGCVLQFEASDEYVEEFAVGDAEAVELVGLEGDVRLRGMSTDTAKMRGTRRATGATKELARRNLESARLLRGLGGDTLLLALDIPLEKVGLVELELDRVSTLPRDMGVSLSVEAGDIEIDGLEGELFLSTGSGDIDAAGGAGDLSAEAPGGTVRVQTAGTVSVEAGDGAQVEVTTESDRSIGIATDGGDVVISMPLQAFRLTCRPGDGVVEVDEGFDALLESDTDGTIVYTAGDGGREIEVETGGGDLRLRISPEED